MWTRNVPLVTLLSIALLLTGCESTQHTTETGESGLLHQMAEPAHSEPASPSMWGDHPAIKTAMFIGLVAGALAGVALMGVAIARVNRANQI